MDPIQPAYPYGDLNRLSPNYRPWWRTWRQHAVDKLPAAEGTVAIFVLSPEEVGYPQLLGSDPRDVTLSPELEVKILKALQLQSRNRVMANKYIYK